MTERSAIRRWTPFVVSLLFFVVLLVGLQRLFFRVELTQSERVELEQDVAAFWRDRIAGHGEQAWLRLGGRLRRQYSRAEWLQREAQVSYESAEATHLVSERLGRARVTVRFRWRLTAELFLEEPVQETTAVEIWESSRAGWRRVAIVE